MMARIAALSGAGSLAQTLITFWREESTMTEFLCPSLCPCCKIPLCLLALCSGSTPDGCATFCWFFAFQHSRKKPGSIKRRNYGCARRTTCAGYEHKIEGIRFVAKSAPGSSGRASLDELGDDLRLRPNRQ